MLPGDMTEVKMVGLVPSSIIYTGCIWTKFKVEATNLIFRQEILRLGGKGRLLTTMNYLN